MKISMKKRVIAIIASIAIMVYPLCTFSPCLKQANALTLNSLPAMPPAGYDQGNKYPAGNVKGVSYFSPSQGTNDTMYIYTPPGYNGSQKCSVVYAYPGIGASADTIFADWCVNADTVADNLIGQGKIQPVIIVAIDDNKGDVAKDTLNVILPYIDSHYNTYADADHRGLYGYSWGGGYTFNIGCSNLDTFHHLGPSSAAPDKSPDSKLFPNGGAEAKQKLKTLFISCGDSDNEGLYPNSLNCHNYCDANGIPHYWLSVPGGKHDAGVWRPAMWNFLQLAFGNGGNLTPTPSPTPSSAFKQIEAENFSSQSGIQTESCSEGGQDIGFIENGDYAVYKNIDFGSGSSSFQARVASAASGSNIEIRLDSIDGKLVGTCSAAGTGGWQTWGNATCSVSGVSGVHDLYLKFTGGSGYLLNVNWFKFTSGVTPTPTVTPKPTVAPTAIPTVTPKPTAVPTITPKPTTVPTVTPTPTAAGNIQVKMFNGTTASSSSAINPKFILTNTGNTAINLSNVKVRYYYTVDGDKTQSFWCDWSTIGAGNVTGKMVKMTTPKTNADYYIELGFTSTAGSLNPGSSIEVQTRVSKIDWSNYTQTNDYSFNSTASSYTVSSKVTAFINGSLSFGIEP